jgi:hypothetical protein
MPVILTTTDEYAAWMRGPWNAAKSGMMGLSRFNGWACTFP